MNMSYTYSPPSAKWRVVLQLYLIYTQKATTSPVALHGRETLPVILSDRHGLKAF